MGALEAEPDDGVDAKVPTYRRRDGRPELADELHAAAKPSLVTRAVISDELVISNEGES